MANLTYTAFRSGIMGGLIDLDTAVFKVALVRAYVFDAGDVFMSDVTGSGGVLNGVSAALTGCTIVDGVWDADDPTITAGADPANHTLVVFQASAVGGGADVADTAQRLVCHMDTGTGLPVVPTLATTITVTWPNTAGKIIKIG